MLKVTKVLWGLYFQLKYLPLFFRNNVSLIMMVTIVTMVAMCKGTPWLPNLEHIGYFPKVSIITFKFKTPCKTIVPSG